MSPAYRVNGGLFLYNIEQIASPDERLPLRCFGFQQPDLFTVVIEDALFL